MLAYAIVQRLLGETESDRADSDPALHPYFPRGFRATRGDDVFVAEYDAKAHRYRYTKHWRNEWTGKPQVVSAGMQYVRTPTQATALLHRLAQDYRISGWEVELFDPV